VPRYVAFLRAINVGGRVVKMDRLRTLFEALELDEVATFIASGNVLFTSPSRSARALEEQIERRLDEALGYAVATFLRTPAELAAVAAYQPFGAADPLAAGHALSVGFLKAQPAAVAQEKLRALGTEIDELHVHGRELYWLRREKGMGSLVTFARLERTLGLPATFRNVTTVRKLAAKCAVAG
jgi:uncharacterized protein (DUF1697 family)